MTRNTIHFVERFKPSIILFTLLCCLFLAGCTEGEKQKKEDGENHRINQEVVLNLLKHEFTYPNKEYSAVYKAMENSETTVEGETSKYDEYLEKIYHPYFTDSEYSVYTRAFANHYLLRVEGTGYSMKLENWEIVHNEDSPKNHNFTAYVSAKNKEGNRIEGEVKGIAIFNEPGKIGKINFTKDTFTEQLVELTDVDFSEEKVEHSKQAIRAVIEKEFNAPDEKYKELSEEMWEAGAAYGDDAEGYKAFTESPEYKAVFNHTEDTYASYFTENGYDNFVNQGQAFYYTNFAGEYTLNASDIEINQSENGDTLYNFTFQVDLTDKNGETSQFDLKGNAIVPEEGKIGKIEFKDDGFKLTQAIEANE